AADRVAHAVLAMRGSGEEPVALLLEKDAPLMAAIMGVLKAGKICVMLDPSFPAARMSAILDDLQAGLMLTNNRHHSLTHEFIQDACHVLNIDTLAPHASMQNPELSISPDALYSIMYTSGSSGVPKGVVHTHRNLLHKVMLYTNCFHIAGNDRLTLLGSPSTGQGITDMFCALLNGASLYPLNIREEGLASLAGWLAQEEITLYHSSATVFRYFVATLTGAEAFPHLRLIKLGSEPVSKKDVELYKKHFPPTCLFVNGLSSTETGFIRYYLIDQATPVHKSIVPVGYAVEDMGIVLLDEDGRPVGDEDMGEITVKSPYLALGYWRRPELTQEAFSPDPDDARRRIYRTGDLGRMQPDGCLEHLGRKDFQVKIRGHRIEVAEIELALLEHAGIKEAVVLARGEGPDDLRLVAYMVAAEAWPPTHSEVRRFLHGRLPDYMLPSAFMWVDALPRTAAGKVDRRALPAPGRARPRLATPMAAPRTSIEASLARMWAEVLGLEEIGIEDDFLELGGHSLSATQIVSRVWKTFQVELALRELLEASTVADMAVVITQRLASEGELDDIAGLLAQVEALSDAQAQQLLIEELEPRDRRE
ncbi:MAG: non-ribosomal peptide synthetase, partial [Candidatus Entotheonellia bacterium]